MTVRAELERTIDHPAETVFAELADIERFPGWLVASGVVHVERVEDGPVGAGSRLRIQQLVAGRGTVLEGSITAFEPPHRFALTARDRDGVSVEIDALLTPSADGTRLRWSLRLDLPLRYRMFESLIAPQAERAAALDLEAFKRRLEAPRGS
jgi:uncharacterized protein YndB with AHSA1/START domain